MLELSYDLHIHSCLSPCGDNEMTPANIVGMAYLKGLDVIAITDHNTCKNCKAAIEIAKQFNLTVLCGMELTTAEEVHLLCLFAELEKALEFGDFVYSKLFKINNNEKIFGEQIVCDANDEVIQKEPYLLINAVDIDFFTACEVAEKYGGVAIPAHIDKSSNSVISNLGFIPADASFNCVELKDIGNYERLFQSDACLCDYKIITNSDAHFLGDINEAVNHLSCKSKSPQDIIQTLRNRI